MNKHYTVKINFRCRWADRSLFPYYLLTDFNGLCALWIQGV